MNFLKYIPLELWFETDLLFLGQIPDDTAKSKIIPGKGRKRKAEEGLRLCSREGEESFGGWTNDLPGGARPNWETGEPTGGEGLQGVTTNQVLPNTSHVADGSSLAAEAFWSLLERAGYTMW